MSWRLAKSLETLLNQINTAYPNRSKLSDGTIGDAAHAAVPSDHNPNAEGVVCALDLTHDPAHGFDAHVTANTLITHRHPNLKYVISNRRIAGAWTNWQWQVYSGSNPHDKHIHVSVGVGDDGRSRQPYDDTTNWNIGKENSPMTPEAVSLLYQLMVHRNPNQQELEAGIGKQWYDVATKIDQTPERQKIVGKIKDYDHLYSTAVGLQEQLRVAQEQVKDPKAQEALREIKQIVDKVIKE
jgi:hypothetical protein